MQAATYARVSTQEQAEKGTSLQDQRQRLAERVRLDGHDLVAEFEDGGASGASMDRPGMRRLRQRVAAGGVNIVYATKIDRVGRSLPGFLDLCEELAAHDCSVALTDEGINTSTAAGTMHGQLLSVIGAFERARISERTRNGRRNAAQQGRFVGSTPPFGYRVGGEHQARRLLVDEDQAKTIRAIYERLVVAQVQARVVAAELNEAGMRPAKKTAWDAATLRRWAKDTGHIDAAAGTWHFAGVEVPIPPIITLAESAVWRTWARETRRLYPQRAPQEYLLSSFILMPCGRRAMGRTTEGRLSTYSCRDRLTAGVSGHDECHNLWAKRLDSTVIHEVRQVLLQPAVLRTAAAGSDPRPSPGTELVRIQAELTALDNKIAEEVALLRAEGLRRESVTAVLRPLKAQQEGLESSARGLRRKVAEESTGLEARHVRQAVARLRTGLQTDDPDVWRQVLETLHVVVRVEGHAVCDECDGSGYLGLRPGSGRGFPRHCTHCLYGTVPVLDVEMDDVVALSVAESLSGEVGA